MEEKLLKINKSKYWIYTGVITLLLAYTAFSLSNMLSGGIYVILRGDLLETHVSYVKMVINDFLNGGSIWYSFSLSMGMNTALTLAYYVMSPFNILFLIFPNVDINIITAVIIISKMAIAGSAFQLFCSRVLKVEDYRSIVFSLFYAFCGFMCAYGSYHIMWIDAFLLLPIICFLIANAFEKNEFWPVMIAYSYLFISQFYMAYMVGFFTLLFVILYIVFYINKENKKIYLYRLVKWVGSVCVAVMISAFILLPAAIFLINNNPPDATSFNDIKVTILEIFNSMFLCQFTDIVGRHSYSYSGLLTLMFVPLYFFDKNNKVKEKIVFGIALTAMIIASIYLPVYKFMHAFDSPDCFWFRFSFITSFVMCAIAARESLNLYKIKLKSLIVLILSFVIIYSVEIRLVSLEGDTVTKHTSGNLLLNVLFFGLWCIVIYLIQNSTEKYKVALALLSILLTGTEVFLNAKDSVGYGPTREEAYYNWVNASTDVLDRIKANEESESNKFYRILIDNDIIHNSDSMFNYNGVIDFGSSENYNLRKVLSNIGFSTTPRMSTGTGYNPVANMILGVKYVSKLFISLDVITSVSDMKKYEIEPLINLYECTLNLGYMVEDDIEDYNFPSRNVFANMNDLLSHMTGTVTECFTKIPKDNIKYTYKDASVFLMDGTDGPYYVDMNYPESEIHVEINDNSYDKVFVQFEKKDAVCNENDYVISCDNIVNGLDDMITGSGSMELYKNSEKNVFFCDIYRSEGSAIEAEFDSINYYSYDADAQRSVFDNLSGEQMIVSDYKSGYVKGEVTVDGDRRLLMTTIPYDEGWKCFVNGSETNIIPIVGDAFVGVKLPDKGVYELEFKYEAPGAKKGFLVSILGCIILIASVLFYFLKKKNNKHNKSDETESAVIEETSENIEEMNNPENEIQMYNNENINSEN